MPGLEMLRWGQVLFTPLQVFDHEQRHCKDEYPQGHERAGIFVGSGGWLVLNWKLGLRSDSRHKLIGNTLTATVVGNQRGILRSGHKLIAFSSGGCLSG